MTDLLVRSCGPMSSLQDGGRIGAQRFGVSRSGAMDLLALAHANALVGNGPEEGAVELALLGGTFEAVGGPIRIALSGSAAPLSVGGAPVPPGRSASAAPGEEIVVGTARAGVYAYLAVAGGYGVAPALGSVSLQPRAAIGGLGGRALLVGDRLPVRREAPDGPEMRLDAPPLGPDAALRVVLGPQDDHFAAAEIEAFLSQTYRVSAEADRMGYRLAGQPIRHLRGFNIVSDGLVAGSVQVPGSGVPIVMLADHQTTGGYPKIATVITPDLRGLAQRRTGEAVRFAAIDLREAQRLARERRALMGDMAGRAVPVRAALPDVETLLGLNLAGDATDARASS